jgi:hypothetical protein
MVNRYEKAAPMTQIERQPREPESAIERCMRRLANHLERPSTVDWWREGYAVFHRTQEGLSLVAEVRQEGNGTKPDRIYHLALINGPDGIGCSFARPLPREGRPGWIKVTRLDLNEEEFMNFYNRADSLQEVCTFLELKHSFTKSWDGHEEIELEGLLRMLEDARIVDCEVDPVRASRSESP